MPDVNPLVVWPILLQAVIPIAVVVALSVGPTRSRAWWGAHVLMAAMLIVTVALAGLWLALPWYLPWVMGALLVASALRGANRESRRRRSLMASGGTRFMAQRLRPHAGACGCCAVPASRRASRASIRPAWRWSAY